MWDSCVHGIGVGQVPTSGQSSQIRSISTGTWELGWKPNALSSRWLIPDWKVNWSNANVYSGSTRKYQAWISLLIPKKYVNPQKIHPERGKRVKIKCYNSEENHSFGNYFNKNLNTVLENRHECTVSMKSKGESHKE